MSAAPAYRRILLKRSGEGSGDTVSAAQRRWVREPLPGLARGGRAP